MSVLRFDQAVTTAIRDAQSAGVALAVFAPADEGGAVDGGESLAALPGALSAPVAAGSLFGAALAVTSQGIRAVVEIDARSDPSNFEQLVISLRGWRAVVGEPQAPVLVRIRAGGGRSRANPPVVTRALRALAGWPGIAVALPGDAASCYGLTRSALGGDIDAVIVEDGELAASTADIAGEPVPLGQAAVVRPGSGLSLVAAGRQLRLALQAAGQLAPLGVEIEVLDPRSIAPFDDAAVALTLERTAKLLVLHEPDDGAGWAQALVGRVVAANLDLLDAPPVLLAAADDGVDEVIRAASELAAY